MKDVYPRLGASSLPWLTIDQMREADRLAVDEFGISVLQMMEHAGRALAEVVMTVAPVGMVAILAGGGNNGGGGLSAARQLINRGREVSITLGSDRLGPAPSSHLDTLAEMGVVPSDQPEKATVVIDALVGYGLSGPLRGSTADLAAWSAGRTVISLDFPSGHGHPGAIIPEATLTLALPKLALGDLRPLYLADIGLPEALWRRLGVNVGPIFRPGSIVEVI